MSRKRSHTRAFAITDSSENGIYLLPGCYHNPQRDYRICDDCYNPSTDMYFVNEQPRVDSFGGDGLYIADACGNVFYNSDVGYIIYEEVVCYSEARMETDDISDPGSECENKKARTMPSSDEEEPAIDQATKKPPGYIVTEPSEDDEGKTPTK